MCHSDERIVINSAGLIQITLSFAGPSQWCRHAVYSVFVRLKLSCKNDTITAVLTTPQSHLFALKDCAKTLTQHHANDHTVAFSYSLHFIHVPTCAVCGININWKRAYRLRP